MNNIALTIELNQYDNYINKLVWKFAKTKNEFNELKSIAITGFYNAKIKFNELIQVKEIDFKTVLVTRINAEIIDYLRLIHGRNYSKVNNQVDLSTIENETYSLNDNNLDFVKIEKSMEICLNQDEKTVLRMYLKGFKQRTIAEYLNVNESRITQIKNKSIKKIKKYLKLKSR